MNEEPLKHIKNLGFPRLCGEGGEEKARDYILDTLKAADIRTELQHFTAYRFPDVYLARIAIVIWMLLLFLSLYFIQIRPIISLFFIIFIGISILLMSSWHPTYEKFFDIPLGRRIHSSNILAKIVNNTTDPLIVFMAHYDSKSQMIPIYMRTATLMLLPFGTLALAILIMAIIILGTKIFYSIAYWCGAFVGISMLLLLLNRSVDESPGAMDNATGVSVLLELARHFKETSPVGVNLYFLFTGAEEIGLCGAVRFLQKYRSFPQKNTYVVNLDGVGGKEKLLIIDHYGILPPVTTSNVLGKKIKDIASSLNIALHTIPLITGALWDHVVWASQGYESVTLSMGSWERATLYVHSERDSWEHINPGALAKTEEICKQIVASVASQ